MNMHIAFFLYNFQTIKTSARDIYNDKTTLKEADEDQNSLLVDIMNFKNKAKPQDPEKTKKYLYALLDGRERVLVAFESKIFPIKIEGTGFSDFDNSNLKNINS